MKRRDVKYAIKARKQYEKDNDKQKFINTVWEKIQIYANVRRNGRHIVENSTRAFLSLTKGKSKDSWIDGKLILAEAKIKNYKWNKSYGLWPWLEETGAGIIQEQGRWPDTQYKVNSKFYETLGKVVMGWTSKAN